MCFFLPLHHHLLTSSIAAVPRTLGQHVHTEAALRRRCSSDEALGNIPSPTKPDVISGVDAVRFTGLRRVVSTLLMDTKDPKALNRKPVVFARPATPTPEGRGLRYELEAEAGGPSAAFISSSVNLSVRAQILGAFGVVPARIISYMVT
ncbi:hypothetical protein C8J57DRAFT_1589173 [Mycena rebaudengoi]|nr:hypothetical protein C8J57DRAFT_1589173 [Mycena rebaudengoi]